MKYRNILASFMVVGALSIANAASPAPPATEPAYLTAALKSTERPPLDFGHDDILKPGAVMTLSEAKPGMVALDLVPGQGYYTRILSRIVGEKGRVYSLVAALGRGTVPLKNESYNLMPPYAIDIPRNRIESALITAHQPGLPNVLPYFEWIGGQEYPNDVRYEKLALPEQIDLAISAYGYHVLYSAEFARVDMADFDKVLYRNMKNNGVVIIVDNAAAKGASPKISTALNRIDPDVVKADMTAAGFVLENESDALARSNDDHTKIADDVLMIPNAQPADGFILKFRKPKNAPNTNKRPADYAKALAGAFGNTIVSGTAPMQEIHFMHPDGTYQEISKNRFDSGRWFYNVDGWNCRYRPLTSFADCHNYPGEYENRSPGDHWNNGVQRRAWKKTELGANQVMVPGDEYQMLKGYDYSIVLGK